MSEVIVSNVALAPEGIDVQFIALPDDVRSDGTLIVSRTYSIGVRHPEYGDDVRDVIRAVTELVEEVHAGFAEEPIAATPADEDDDDEDEGMGS